MTVAARSRRRSALGLVWIAVPVVAAASAFGSVVDGHPAYPTLLAACLLVGVVLVVHGRRGVTDGDVDADVAPVSRGRRVVRALGVTAALLATALMVGLVVAGRPHPPHTDAVAAMRGTAAVRVTDDATSITLTPTRPTSTGVIFQPGARTDARSYVPILSRLAERGHVVVIAKQPLSIAPLAQGRAEEAFASHPEVTRWVAGGHSFGGVPARATGESGDPRVVGVVVWATYARGHATPAVPTLALYGTADRLIPPSDATGPDTPTLRHVPVDGAVHTSFSDYGPARGDGTETRPHEAIQTDIVDLTDAFIRSVAP